MCFQHRLVQQHLKVKSYIKQSWYLPWHVPGFSDDSNKVPEHESKHWTPLENLVAAQAEQSVKGLGPVHWLHCFGHGKQVLFGRRYESIQVMLQYP